MRKKRKLVVGHDGPMYQPVANWNIPPSCLLANHATSSGPALTLRSWLHRSRKANITFGHGKRNKSSLQFDVSPLSTLKM